MNFCFHGVIFIDGTTNCDRMTIMKFAVLDLSGGLTPFGFVNLQILIDPSGL